MNIHNYIADFLLSNDKLYLPGLGSLEKVRKEAGLNEGKIEPPGYDLIFTSEENPDDENRLARMIASGEDISLEESQQRVLEYIDDIKFSFNKEEVFHIENVCSLELDENNNIVVEKDPDFIIDPEYYGLESFEIDNFEAEEEDSGAEIKDEEEEDQEFYSEKMGRVLDEEQDMRKFEETYIRGPQKAESQASEHEEDKSKTEDVRKDEGASPASTPSESIPQPPPPPPVPPVPPRSEEDHSKSKKGKRILVFGLSLAAVAAIIVGFFILFPTEVRIFEQTDISFEDIFGKKEEMKVDDDFSDIKDEEFDIDNLVDELEEDLDSSEKMEHALDITGDEEKTAAEEEVSEYVEYHIIAGSFRDYKNAQELQQELTLQGYPSLVLEPGTGIYRVSAASFNDKVTALNRLVEFREKTGLETAWLMNLE